MNNQPSDSRIGLRNADGAVIYWPDTTISGALYNRTLQAPMLHDIGDNRFVVLDVFTPRNFDLNAALVALGGQPQLERTVSHFDNNTLSEVFVPVVPSDAVEAVQDAARAAVDAALEQHAAVREEALAAKAEPVATSDAWDVPVPEYTPPTRARTRLDSESVNDDDLPQIPGE